MKVQDSFHYFIPNVSILGLLSAVPEHVFENFCHSLKTLTRYFDYESRRELEALIQWKLRIGLPIK